MFKVTLASKTVFFVLTEDKGAANEAASKRAQAEQTSIKFIEKL